MTKTVSAEATEPSATEASSTPDEATVGGVFEEATLGETSVTLGEGRGTTEVTLGGEGEGGTTGLGETTTEAASQLETTTEAAAAAEAETTTATAVVEESASAEDDAKEDESLNEIDTDGFVVSQDTLDSAKKYGYKILLKKVKLI